MAPIQPSHLAIAAILLTLGYLLARWLYPKPIPGIPYNHASARRLLGDLPSIQAYTLSGRNPRSWFLSQAHQHHSAITQVFLGPLEKPNVIVSDYAAVAHILSHRDAVDFAKGRMVSLFTGIFPHAFPLMETFDPQFRQYRDAMHGLMAPATLSTVNAPRLHQNASSIIELWRGKAALADGHPFDVARDVTQFAWDTILGAATALDEDGGDVGRQRNYIAKAQSQAVVSVPAVSKGKKPATGTTDHDDPVTFTAAPSSTAYAAANAITDALWPAFIISWPRWYNRLGKLRPAVWTANLAIRERIRERIAPARARLARPDAQLECALDFILQREQGKRQSNKTDSKSTSESKSVSGDMPLSDARVVDAIYTYLVAGYDTTAGALLWLLYELVRHPRYQTTLRAHLRAAYPEAVAEKRPPTASELVDARRRPAFLDAFVEETLRVHAPVPVISVQARHDTTVLGRSVPKGTRVVLNLTGASLSGPAVPRGDGVGSAGEEEGKKASTGTDSGLQRQSWDGSEPETFRPERWLRQEDQGSGEGKKLLFDASLGPLLTFSAGNRGCWGKRLAYLGLRMALALVVWEFELAAPEKLLQNIELSDSLAVAPKKLFLRAKEAKE